MAFESMENSSQTALPTSKIIGDESLPLGLTANTSSRQEAFGSSQTLIAGASTAGTLARFVPQSFNTDSAPYGRFAQKFLSLSIFLPAIAVIISAVAWSGHVATIPLSLLAPLFLYHAQSRRHSYATLFCYYIGASWPLIPGASTFFGTGGNIVEGLLICLSASALLALPAALLFTKNRTVCPFAISAMFLFTALPPLGIIGWASPLLSAGVLFPGTAWFGVIGTLALLPLFGRFPVQTATTVALVALTANGFYRAPSPPAGWQAINTQFGGAGQGDPDFLSEFISSEQIQSTITQSNAHVLLFPEHVVTQWTEATEAFWHESLDNLAARDATLIIGAGLPRKQGSVATTRHAYYNTVIARGKDATTVYYQRIPVPIAMWNPLSTDGVPLDLFGPGTISVQDQRAAVLICYEQLLVWPFLSSEFEHPTILVTAANDYWAKNTRIPKVQSASASSLARLFGLPVLSAVNE
jgi:apolipoprotein N-acyltransferase